MKLSELIKQLQEIEKKEGGEIDVFLDPEFLCMTPEFKIKKVYFKSGLPFIAIE